MIKDLIVRIKTVFAGSGKDAVAGQIKEVTKASDGLKESTDKVTKATREHTQAQADESNKLKETGGEIEKKTGSVNKLSSSYGAMKASAVSSVKSIQTAVRGLTSALGAITAAVALFWGAWKLGEKIADWIGGLGRSVKDLGPVVIKTKDSFDELNKVKLSALKQEIDEIYSKLDKTLGALDKAANRRKALLAAETEAKVAEVEATIKDPIERERQIAAIRFAADTKAREMEVETTKAKVSAATTAEKEAAARVDAAKAEIESAKQRLAGAQAAGAERWTEATMNQIKEARNQLMSAQEVYSKSLEDWKEKQGSLGDMKEDFKTALQVADIEGQTSGTRYSTTVSGLDQRKSEAAAKADQERRLAELAAREAQIKSEADARMRQVDADMAPAASAAQAARSQADAFDASRGRYKSAKERTAAQEYDGALEREALAAAAQLEQLKQTRVAIAESMRQQTAELENIRKDIRQQNKNLPIY